MRIEAATNADAIEKARRECRPLTRGRDLGFDCMSDAEDEIAQLATLALTLADRLDIEIQRSAKLDAMANDAAGSRDAHRDRADRMEIALVALLRREGGEVTFSESEVRDLATGRFDALVCEPPGAPLTGHSFSVRLDGYIRHRPVNR